MQSLDVGESRNIDGKWYDGNGDPAEPSAITLTLYPPSGAAVVKAKADHTGSSSPDAAPTLDVWSYLQTWDQSGLWRFDLEGVVDSSEVHLPSGMVLVGVRALDGPCEPWCTWEDVEACGAVAGDYDTAEQEAIIDFAGSVLFMLSGSRYTGLCQMTTQLCLACARCFPRPCGCLPSSRIDLGSPVYGAWSVTIDGATLDPSAYTVLDRRWLVRLDGQPWPTGTDLGDPDAFRVSYAYGRLVPPAAQRAAALFAREIALACRGTACQLPQRITQITREGVSFAVLDPMTMLKEGRTGIYLVDLWLSADGKARVAPPGMFSPNAPRTERSRV